MEGPNIKPESKPKDELTELMEEIAYKIGNSFDDGKQDEGIDSVTSIIRYLPEDKINFNKDEIISKLEKLREVKEKLPFVQQAMAALEPMLVFMTQNPKEFEDAGREGTMHQENNIKLSRVLYCHFADTQNIYIHIALSIELNKSEGIFNFKNEVVLGLKNLAKIVKDSTQVEMIQGISWIIAKNPKLIESLGFTIEKEVSGDAIAAAGFDVAYDERPFARAFIKREKFLEKYGN